MVKSPDPIKVLCEIVGAIVIAGTVLGVAAFTMMVLTILLMST